MKNYFAMLLVAVLTLGLVSCNGKNEPEPEPEQKKTVDYDKMLGTWTLESYTEKWVNTDEKIVEKDRTVNQGSLTVTKKSDEDGTYYAYTENFVHEEAKEYSGRIEISNGYICLNNPEGFIRDDGANTYDFTVSFPADGRMEWTCNWTGTHKHNSNLHQDKRTVKAVFVKK